MQKTFIFLLAILPALLLGFLLIYLANTATQEYDKRFNPDESPNYLYTGSEKNPSGYKDYLKQLEQIHLNEKMREKNSQSAFDKMQLDWEKQKEDLHQQQEQIRQEQRRIKMLLDQMKKR